MNKSETVLAFILVGVLLCGVAWQNYRGAPKTAEVIIARQGGAPFDADPTPASDEQIESATPAAPPMSDGIVEFLNQADKRQVEQLPGVGDVLAQRIIDYRDANNRFKRLDELMNVSGIGAAKMEDIKAYLRNHAALPAPTPTMTPARAPRIPVEYPMANQKHRRGKPSLNQATLQQLQQVSGIGPQLAKAILTERQRRGGFQSWEQVDAVANVGPSRLKTLQEQFVIR